MIKAPSKSVIDQLNTLQKIFIWDNKLLKIKRSTLVATYYNGAYEDVDTEKKIASLKIRCVARLLDGNFHHWKITPNLLFSDNGSNLTFLVFLPFFNHGTPTLSEN